MTTKWVRLELATTRFDATRFETVVADVLDSGIHITTLADLGDSEDNRRNLYALNAECSKDIPDRGTFYTWGEYVDVRLNVPVFDPGLVSVAIVGAEWVGVSVTHNHSEAGYAFNQITGVTRRVRGRGIALSLKVDAIARLIDRGVRTVRTVHHPKNEAIINLNRRLGYIDATWRYP